MGCPFFREVTMVYCDALPVHRPIPADRVVAQGRCAGGDHGGCAAFRDARRSLSQDLEPSPAEPDAREVPAGPAKPLPT